MMKKIFIEDFKGAVNHFSPRKNNLEIRVNGKEILLRVLLCLTLKIKSRLKVWRNSTSLF